MIRTWSSCGEEVYDLEAGIGFGCGLGVVSELHIE